MCKKGKNIAIVGASGAIGDAIIDEYMRCSPDSNLYAFSRKPYHSYSEKVKSYLIDIESEKSVACAAAEINDAIPN